MFKRLDSENPTLKDPPAGYLIAKVRNPTYHWDALLVKNTK